MGNRSLAHQRHNDRLAVLEEHEAALLDHLEHDAPAVLGLTVEGIS